MDDDHLASTSRYAVVPISRYVIWELDEEQHLTERFAALSKIAASSKFAVDRRHVATALMSVSATICNRQFSLFDAPEVMYG